MDLWLVALLFTASVTALPAGAEENDSKIELITDDYAKAGTLVTLGDGRVMNLRCSGEGAPVVVLEAGGNSESSTWYRVQPLLARLTRVCSYDRAGYGFSGEGPLPRDLDASVADLHALIKAADLAVPLVLVGHSLGSNIVRMYAQRYPEEVAGIVLVDPPEHGADDQMPQAWREQVEAQLAHREEVLAQCEAAAVAGDLSTLEKSCLRAPPPWMSPAVAKATMQYKATPSYWRTLRSELAENIELYAAQIPVDESYGAVPLILLRAAEQEEDAPPDVLQVLEDARRITHERILAASERSTLIDVPDTSHDIQLDQPQAVVSGVTQLLGAKGTASAPDAPSDDAIASQFLGTWRLVSQTQRLDDGTSRQDPKSVAYLIYTDSGLMCYVGMDPNRPLWKSESAPTPEEALVSSQGFGAYCATVEVHAKEGFVIHHVEIAGNPNRVGQTWKRWFTFEGPNRVVLRVDGPSPPVVENTLIWERVEKR